MIEEIKYPRSLNADEYILDRSRSTFSGNNRDTFSSARTARTFSSARLLEDESILVRTISVAMKNFDPDLAVTCAALDDIVKHNGEGNDGDVPFPLGFARTTEFWKLIVTSGMVAVILAFVALGFVNCIDEVPTQWATCAYGNDRDCGDLYTGEFYWIGVTAGTGFCVGFLRYLFSYPDNLPGIFKDIQLCHVEPKWALLTFTLSAISISGGATLGPEQALGNLGGGLATYISQHIVQFSNSDHQKLFILAGMASPLGALFPAPMLGATMVMELSDPIATYMEFLIILSIPCTISFAVFYGMIGDTYTNFVSTQTQQLSVQWIDDQNFQGYMIMTGFAIGCVSAALSITSLVIVGVTKQIFKRIRSRLQSKGKFLTEVVPPVIGGIVIGAINWALPATVGNGKLIFSWIINFGTITHPLLSRNVLMCTGFARMVLLGVSMNSGFVGGIIFPLLTIGLIAGAVMFQMYPYLPVALCESTFMVSIACGFVPLPITFTVMSALLFFLGAYQSIPIFIAVVTSYTIVCGTGFLRTLSLRAQQQEDEENNNKTPAQNDSIVMSETTNPSFVERK